jgi:hypothetical protein
MTILTPIHSLDNTLNLDTEDIFVLYRFGPVAKYMRKRLGLQVDINQREDKVIDPSGKPSPLLPYEVDISGNKPGIQTVVQALTELGYRSDTDSPEATRIKDLLTREDERVGGAYIPLSSPGTRTFTLANRDKPYERKLNIKLRVESPLELTVNNP